MSAKNLHTIADENQDLDKQLGCMNGLFQIFNCQHLVGRRISSQRRKRLLPGECGIPGKERNDSSMHKLKEKIFKEEGVKEGEKTLVESSGSSFSSSSYSSTFSSTHCNKLAQPEPSILDHTTLSKTQSHVVLKKQPDPYFQSCQRSPDIRNIVKDSIQRETCGFSVKTNAKPEGKNCIMYYIDSPRPQEVFKPVNPRVAALDKSSRVLRKESNSALLPKDAPRFSFDERESRDKWKSVAKLRELPRFSLDSRETSIRRAAFASEPRPNSLLEDIQQRSDQRLSSVVAKLMGLEAFPDPTDTNKSRPHENLDPVSTASSRKARENKHNKISNSPRLNSRDASSPKLDNSSSAKPNPRFPLEPAPWRQTNGNQESQNSFAESHPKPQTLYPSIYDQIEKRLTELEFKKSGKDLRALKQILEAMQKATESIEDKKNVSSYKQSHTGNHSPSMVTTSADKRSGSPKKLEVPIAIARPAKAVQKSKHLVSSSLEIDGVPSLRKLRTRENKNTKKELISRQTQCRESYQQSLLPMDKRSSDAIYGSKKTNVRPRMRAEKQFLPSIHTCEASTHRRAVNRHHTETFFHSSNFKLQFHVRLGDEDQLSEISSETRRLSHQGAVFSTQSESNMSIASTNDKATSNYRPEAADRLDKLRTKSGTTPVKLEQPSPISVLDTTFYTEESTSPVKKISTAFIDEHNHFSDEAESDPVDVVSILNSTRPHLVPDFDGQNLENKKQLNDNLRKVESCDEVDAQSIAYLCESRYPMHRYVAEVLSALGHFKDLGPSSTFTQLHPSGRFINPHLFHILEQAKSRTEVEDDEQSKGKINQSKLQEKIDRRLVFDTTDEILVHILISAGFSDPCISSNKLGLRSLTGKKLLEKICSQMNHLQSTSKRSLPYEDDTSQSEVPGVVLDIERLIFKDLICEIVSEKAGLPSRLNKHHRQLFTN